MPSSLPSELLVAVFDNISRKSDLLALSTVSRIFRSIVFPRLFRVLTLKPIEGLTLWEFERSPFFSRRMISRVPQVLMALEELHFSAPFRCEVRGQRGLMLNRCPCSVIESDSSSLSSLGSIDHMPIVPEVGGNMSDSQREQLRRLQELAESDLPDYGLSRLSQRISRLVSFLHDEQLIGFRWDMGTCYPEALLGDGGYLETRQSSLRKLSLITDIHCRLSPPPLHKFPNLQELSWKGIQRLSDCQALRRCLEVHHERLTVLELEFFYWDNLTGDGCAPYTQKGDRLVELLIPDHINCDEIFLSNLQTFSMSGAAFRGSPPVYAALFNLYNLNMIRLYDCPYAVEMLHNFACVDKAFQANKVELVLQSPEIGGQGYDLSICLAPFSKLESLFLMFEAPPVGGDWQFDVIHNHSDTLRRLVFHMRHYCLVQESPYRHEYCDSSWDKSADKAFTGTLEGIKLEALGICGEPWKIQATFLRVASAVHSLKMLHLRFTGKWERKPKFMKEFPGFNSVSDETDETGYDVEWQDLFSPTWRRDEDKELEAFADWAFSPEGFPALQVLASGDFSYGDRFAETQTLWCRNTLQSSEEENEQTKTWRPVSPRDFAENELIDANMDMLSACAVSPLIYPHGQPDVFPGTS